MNQRFGLRAKKLQRLPTVPGIHSWVLGSLRQLLDLGHGSVQPLVRLGEMVASVLSHCEEKPRVNDRTSRGFGFLECGLRLGQTIRGLAERAGPIEHAAI